MPRPKMPRGVHVDRATFANCYSIRMVDSDGQLIFQVSMTDAVRRALPSDHIERLWEILEEVNPVNQDDTPPFGIRLLA